MKIIFVTPSLKTGGGIRVFIELANKLVESYEVLIVYPNNSEDKCTFTLDNRIKLLPIGKLAISKLDKLNNIRHLIKHLNKYYKNESIIYTDPIFSIFAKFISSKKKTRFIQADDYSIYDDGLILRNKILIKAFKALTKRSYKYKNINHIFNSKFVYESFIKNGGRNNASFRLVHPAISHDIFRNYSLNNREGICIVGRKHPLKGLITFIEAYRLLSTEEKERIGTVRIISHDDLSSFDISGFDIIKPQNDNDIAIAYNKSKFFVSTSWWEGFGLPPLEAMACGCCAILSNSKGINEFAVNNRNCKIFEPKDAYHLKELLIEISLNDNEYDLLSKNGEKDAAEFSWDKSSRQLINAINLGTINSTK